MSNCEKRATVHNLVSATLAKLVKVMRSKSAASEYSGSIWQWAGPSRVW